MKRSYRFLDPESKKMPPDYGSKAVKRKLFLLVAGLGLVIVLMSLAGDPNNWAWLTKLDNHKKLNQKLLQSDAAGSAVLSKNDQKQNGPKILLPKKDTLPDFSSFDSFGLEFWKEITGQMASDEQFRLVVWIHRKTASGPASKKGQDPSPSAKNDGNGDKQKGGTEKEPQKPAIERVFDIIHAECRRHQKSTEQQAAEGDAKKKEYLDWLLTQSADSDLSQDGKGKWFQTLRTFIDPALLETVTDGSVMGIGAERAVALRFFHATAGKYSLRQKSDQPKDGNRWRDASQVVNANLMAQPEVYRGKVVEFDGTVQLVRKITLEQPETVELVGSNHCYDCWVATPWAGKIAVNIWCPPGGKSEKKLEVLSGEEDRIHIPVKVKGLFLKKSFYVATGDEQPTSLVMFAPDLDIGQSPNPFGKKQGDSIFTVQNIGLLFLVLSLAMILWRSYLSIPGRSSSGKRYRNRKDEGPELSELEKSVPPKSDTDWSHLKSSDDDE